MELKKCPFCDKKPKTKRNRLLSEDEQLEIAREIINLLAENQCTAREAQEILRSAEISVESSAIVQHLD